MRLRAILRVSGIVWGCVFCGAVIVFAGTGLFHGVYMTMASASWVPQDAKVLAIESHPKSAELQYEYVFRGTRYSGNTLAFLSEGSIPDKRIVESSYRVGDQIRVLVDPLNPSESVVLRRPLKFEYVWVYVVSIVLTCLIGWRIIKLQIAALKEKVLAPSENS